MKLVDVARASLAELLGDYEIYLAERGVVPWSAATREHQVVTGMNPAGFEYTRDVMHDYWTYFQRERKAFEPWLDSEDPVVVANAMLIMIRRTMAMLSRQMQVLGEVFLQDGGFRERLHQGRVEARAGEAAPACPECGKPMQKRTARAGQNAGQEFWGCSGYSQCRGIRRGEGG
jgi:four helix bundle suffix protein